MNIISILKIVLKNIWHSFAIATKAMPTMSKFKGLQLKNSSN